MNETIESFYTGILGVQSPWVVTSVNRDNETRTVTARVEHSSESDIVCPNCGVRCGVYDHRIRRWRHLDTCNHQTIIEASVPRIECAEHGVKQVPVTWAEKNSKFTLEFERAILLWLKDDSISSVANNFGLSWDQVNTIMERAVKRGLKRREQTQPENIGIDETSFQKRHEYVTVILDKDRDVVIDILQDRKAKTLDNWLNTQELCDFSGLRSITMDMWDPFIKAVMDNIPDAANLIAFDRYHVAQHFGKALDRVRAKEFRELSKTKKSNPLLKTKYDWLRNSERTDNRESKRRKFMPITKMNLKTARAWRIKEAAGLLWDYSYMGVAQKEWGKLLGWISRCRLDPIIKVGKMIKSYFWGIMNAIRLKANNAMLEAKNSKIQKIKSMACGFRNRNRFKMAILFHLGGLDMEPTPTL